MIMQEQQIREALNKDWQALPAGDAAAEHDIYEEDAICEYPRRRRILGRSNLQALRSGHANLRISTPGEFSETVTSGSRIHNHLPRAASVQSEHYGIRRQ